ncbi:SDR family NAD(P)-dependent oxidoreductase, partial [Rhodococcus opacus]|uniref:SDR family NAD(P)-dependent oxidoreductase n=2 Tax=Rhodococcus TaxID=1827 RepID=UPI000F0A6D1D
MRYFLPDGEGAVSMTSSSMNGRVIAVTGGARGIGREIARQLALAGARVAIG